MARFLVLPLQRCVLLFVAVSLRRGDLATGSLWFPFSADKSLIFKPARGTVVTKAFCLMAHLVESALNCPQHRQLRTEFSGVNFLPTSRQWLLRPGSSRPPKITEQPSQGTVPPSPGDSDSLTRKGSLLGKVSVLIPHYPPPLQTGINVPLGRLSSLVLGLIQFEVPQSPQVCSLSNPLKTLIQDS